MQLLLDFVIFVLKSLIFVGDFVLLLITLFVNALKRLCKFLISGFKILEKKTKKDFSLIQNTYRRFWLTKKKEKKQKPPVYKRKKRIKPAKIFPLPIGVKIKYFSLGILISLTFIFLPLLILIFLQDLPNPKILGLMQSPQSSKIYDRNGKLLFQIYATQNRTYIPLSEIPKSLQDATIAIEDKSFYKNPGFDAKAIIRAALSNLSRTVYSRRINNNSTINKIHSSYSTTKHSKKSKRNYSILLGRAYLQQKTNS